MISEDNRDRIRSGKPKLKFINGEYLCWFDDTQIWLRFPTLRQACQFIKNKMSIRNE